MKTVNREDILRMVGGSSSVGNSSVGNSSGGEDGGSTGLSQYWVETNFVSRADYDAKIAELEQRIQDLEDRVTALEGGSTP